MATRFYLLPTTAADVSPAYNAEWDSTANAVRRKMSTTKDDNTTAAQVIAGTASNPADVLFRQYVSDPLAAQTLTAATLTGSIRCTEAAAGNNAFIAIGARIVSNDGSSFHATTLLTPQKPTAGSAVEFSTTATSRRFRDQATQNTTIALTDLTINDGDRLVIEVAVADVGASTANVTLDFTDNSASDLDHSDADTGNDNTWIEISQTLNFQGAGGNASRAMHNYRQRRY